MITCIHAKYPQIFGKNVCFHEKYSRITGLSVPILASIRNPDNKFKIKSASGKQ